MPDASLVLPRRMVFAVAAIVTAVVLIVGGAYYRSEEAGLRAQAEQELTAIATLKGAQVAGWRNERLVDGQRVTRAPGIRSVVAAWLEGPADDSPARVLEALESLRVSGRFHSAYLTDVDGQALFGTAETDDGLPPETLVALEEAVDSRSAVLSGVHGPGDDMVFIDVVSPVLVGEGDDTRTLAVVVLRADVSATLLPAIELWPVPRQTAEALLVERVGDEVVVVSNPRHSDLAPFELRVPLERTDTTLVRAILGERGIIEGPDYRGVTVLSYIVEVPDSPWLLLAEVDRAEAFADWADRSRLIIGIIMLLATLLVGTAMVAWQRIRTVRLAQLLAQERALRAAEERLGVTLAAVGDAVIATDAHGRIEFMNPVAEQLTGWPAAEASGRPLPEVFRIINEETRAEVESPADRVLREGVVVGLANHTLLVARDGTERAIADSGAPIRDADGAITGVVLAFRDQTEERAAMRVLAESEERFRALIEQTDQGISVGRPDGTMLVYNSAMERISGYTREEVERHGWFELVFPTEERRAEALRLAQKAIEGGVPYVEVAIVRKDGQKRWLSVTTTPITLAGITYNLSVFTDVTDRTVAEERLRASEERFRALVETAPDAIFVQTSHRFAYVNAAGCRLYGAESPDDLIGRPVLERFHPDYHDVAKRRIEALNVRREPQGPMDQVHLRMDGSPIYVEVSGAPVVYEGEPGAVVFVRDVTERKRVEEVVALRARLLEFAVSHTVDELLVYSLDELGTALESRLGFFHFADEGERTLALAAWSSTTMDCCDVSEYSRHYSFDEAGAWVDCVRERRVIIHEDFAALPDRRGHPDGHPDIVRELLVPVFRDDKAVAVLGMGNKQRPYTESDVELAQYVADVVWETVQQKRTERLLTESEELVQLAGQLARLGGWSVDLASGIVEWSDAVAEIHGMPAGYSPPVEEGISFYAPEYRDRITEVFTACAEDGVPYDEEMEIIAASGRHVWVRTIGVPVRDESGAIVGVHGAFQDVTEQKRASLKLDRHREHLEDLVAERTRDLEDANAELVRVSAVKSSFLASMSHELRTPLNSIIGFSGILLQGLVGEISAEQRNQIGMINSSGKHLLAIIDDILDISRIEAGKVDIDARPLDPAAIVAEVADILRPLADEKALELRIRVPEEPMVVESDRGKVKQILLNLGGNAVKYTDAGRVEITLSRHEDDAVAFSVRDTGRGIRPDMLERVFESFTQGDHRSGEVPRGTGLGLTISREYARLLGGDITAESEPGRGSTFTLVLPIRP